MYENHHYPRLETGLCSRTREIANAELDLGYLRSLKDPSAFIYGRVGASLSYSDYRDGGVAEIPISVRRLDQKAMGDVRRLRTGAEGNFRFDQLSPGEYLVSANFGATVDPDPMEAEVDLEDPEDCAEVSFHYQRAGQISGRLASSFGEPLPGLVVRAVALEAHGGIEILTEEDGNFTLQHIPEGIYRIATVVPCAFRELHPGQAQLPRGLPLR